MFELITKFSIFGYTISKYGDYGHLIWWRNLVKLKN